MVRFMVRKVKFNVTPGFHLCNKKGCVTLSCRIVVIVIVLQLAQTTNCPFMKARLMTELRGQHIHQYHMKSATPPGI